MKFPPATRKDHERFCIAEEWVQRATAKGKTGTHHVNYELPLPDGRILYTRISHPVNRDTYGSSLWSHILRDQLDVTAHEFWTCVHTGVTPDRGGVAEPPVEAIPLEVVTLLLHRFHIPEAEVRAMTKDEAIVRMIKEFNRDSP